MTNKEYITMMEDSLVKKVELLGQLQGLNLEQKNILEDDESSTEAFEDNMDMKAGIIDRLDKMDEGFQSLYDKVKEELDSNREGYKSEIKHMQELIRRINDLSADIQAEEMRNKQLAKKRFSYVRSNIRETRHSQKAVATYYSNMSQTIGYEDSQFWDKKQ